MTLQVALSAPILICPDNGAAYSLDGRTYTLMNGKTSCLAHLVNVSCSPATVAGSIAGAAGTLTIEAREGVVIGWDVAATTWRALRMVGTRVIEPEQVPPDVRLGIPADATLWVEALDGSAARITLSAIVEYLAGKTPTLAVCPSPTPHR